MGLSSRFNLGVGSLAILAVAVAGCATPRQNAAGAAAPPAQEGTVKASSAKKKAAARNPVPLSPGCPLGATAVLGLSLVEKGCNAGPRPRPAGPIGVPNATP
jgi:hypothetical protein